MTIRVTNFIVIRPNLGCLGLSAQVTVTYLEVQFLKDDPETEFVYKGHKWLSTSQTILNEKYKMVFVRYVA